MSESNAHLESMLQVEKEKFDKVESQAEEYHQSMNETNVEKESFAQSLNDEISRLRYLNFMFFFDN